VSVVETLKCSLEVTRGHIKMVPLESLGTVSYSRSIATMAVSLAVSTQYTNVTDRHTRRQEPRYAASLGCNRAAKAEVYYEHPNKGREKSGAQDDRKE